MGIVFCGRDLPRLNIVLAGLFFRSYHNIVVLSWVDRGLCALVTN